MQIRTCWGNEGFANLATTSGRPGLDALALTDLYRGLVVDCGGTHALFDLSCHGEEGLLDVGSVLGGCLEEGDSNAVSEFLAKR